MRTSEDVAGLAKVMSNFMSINVREYTQLHPKMDTVEMLFWGNGGGFCSFQKLNYYPSELIFEA